MPPRGRDGFAWDSSPQPLLSPAELPPPGGTGKPWINSTNPEKIRKIHNLVSPELSQPKIQKIHMTTSESVHFGLPAGEVEAIPPGFDERHW